MAGWLFVAVAVLFVGAVVGLALVGRSVYLRSRALAQELTSLGADLERIMSVVGQPTPGPGDNPGP